VEKRFLVLLLSGVGSYSLFFLKVPTAYLKSANTRHFKRKNQIVGRQRI